jgi:hypothetical protein
MVQTELNESGAGVPSAGTFWPVQQVYDAVNDAQMEFDSIAYLPMGSATLSFTQGGDLVAWPNTTLMWPQWLEFSGRKYWVIKHADLERYDRNWRSASQDQPRFFVMWDERHIRPYPLADQTYVFTVWGPVWPTEIVSTNTDVSVPPLLKTALALRASARLFQQSRPDLAAADLKEAEYYEALYRIQWRKQQSHNIRRLLPVTQNGFTMAQGGNIRIGKRIDGNPSNPYR